MPLLLLMLLQILNIYLLEKKNADKFHCQLKV